MGDKKRFLFSYSGQPRRLISLDEAADGTVVLVPPRLSFGDLGTSDGKTARMPLKERRFSIHPTHGQLEFNTIKHTSNYDAEVDPDLFSGTTAFRTYAIKRDRSFCRFASFRLAAFEGEIHHYRKPGLDLGFDTYICQPFIHLVVSAPDIEIDDSFAPLYLVEKISFQFFNVYILVNFLPVPAWREARYALPMSMPRDSGLERFDGTGRGLVVGELKSELKAIEAGLRFDILDWVRIFAGEFHVEMDETKFLGCEHSRTCPRDMVEFRSANSDFLRRVSM